MNKKDNNVQPTSNVSPSIVSRRTRKVAIIGGLLTIVLIIIAIVMVILLIGSKMAAAAAAKEEANGIPSPAALPRVAVVEIKGVPFEDKIQLPGTLSPWKSVKLGAEVSGPVVTKSIEEGDRVEEGQVIFKIDTDTLETEVSLAQTRLELAEKELKRTQELFEQGFSPREKLDADESDVQQQSASVRLKELQLEKATVQAPISGVINKEYVEAGDFVNIGSPLCEIIQTDRMKMVVGVPEKDVVYLSEGQEVPVQMDALTARGEKPLNGKISKIIPAADDVTHTFSVEIEINEPGPLARPGMIGRAELTRRKIHDAILIPIFAITRHSEGYAVFVEENGVAKRRIITMGSFLTQGIQVDEGLKAGDNLIIRGQRDLVDGEKVEVAKRISGDAFDLAAAMLGRITTNDIERFIDEYIDNAPNAETNNVEQNQ